jgi:hypothetical protein
MLRRPTDCQSLHLEAGALGQTQQQTRSAVGQPNATLMTLAPASSLPRNVARSGSREIGTEGRVVPQRGAERCHVSFYGQTEQKQPEWRARKWCTIDHHSSYGRSWAGRTECR